MSARKGGLNKGRGLEALIGGGNKASSEAVSKADKAKTSEKEEQSLKSTAKPEKKENNAEKKDSKKTSEEKEVTAEIEIRISQIIPNTDQPRKEFDEASLEELSESIKIHGVLQPLLVQKKGKYYEIIAGERRWRAAKLAGLKKVPVIIREYTPRQTLEISLIENIQRQDLNPIDEALAYKRLLDEFQLKQADVAKQVSKSRATITNALRLLKLDPRVQRMLIDNLISTGHARALLSVEDQDLQFEIANRIATEGLNVRDTERLISNLKKQPVERKKTDNIQMSSIYTPVEEQLKEILGTKVSVHPKRSGKGTIEIEFYSPEDLDRILDLLSKYREEQ